MWFENALLGPVVCKKDSRLVALDFRNQRSLNTEVILNPSAAACGELDDVCRFCCEIGQRYDACEHVGFFEIDETRGVECGA